MFRILVMMLMISGVLLGSVDLEAKRGKGPKKKPQLVNRVLVGAGWHLPSIAVINRSSYNRPSVEYAAQLWATTSAPKLYVQHESPMLCSDVKPMINAIILCDAVPWTGPSADGIAGFTANYMQVTKRNKQPAPPKIQATVIWLYQPRWTSEKILRYIPSHELGHALGLGEMNCKCVMTPMVSDNNVLGPEERAAINAIYS